MQNVMVVLAVITVVFWRSLLRLVVAVIVALLVLGGIMVVRTIDSIGQLPAQVHSQGHAVDGGGR
jgi:hypothetical protein